MIPFFSKRNQVYPILWEGHAAAGKWFSCSEDWKNETAVYAELQGKLPLPQVLHAEPDMLVTAYCPCPTLLAVLEAQEQEGFSEKPWRVLARWLHMFYRLTGKTPGEGNLRNYLWDAASGEVLGLDFETCRQQPLSEYGAELIAAILEYAPRDTPVKLQASRLLAELFGIETASITEKRAALRLRRQAKKDPPQLSGIVLAGGQSRRMGQNKSALQIGGKTLLERQVEKLRMLGISDILISGTDIPETFGARAVPDQYRSRGPVGGLHACLAQAECGSCLVLSVDTPLLPVSLLNYIRRSHTEGITVLAHHGKIEPLIGIYDSSLADAAKKLLETERASVRDLMEQTICQTLAYAGPEVFLQNCNTPDDFLSAQQTFEAYAAKGLTL